MLETHRVLQDFSVVSGVGVALIDTRGQTLFHSVDTGTASFVRLMDDSFRFGEQCKYAWLYAGYQSVRFGGRYVFYDPMGLSYFAAPLLEQGVHTTSVIAGPLLMTDYDDYFDGDVLSRYTPTPSLAASLRNTLRAVPIIDPARVHALAEQLYICCAFISGGAADMRQTQETQQLQSHLHTYITSVKGGAAERLYPLQKENELLSAISRGDMFSSRALLNEILGHIFFHSGQDLEVIRSRVIELIALLSRAAVKGGADAEMIFGMNYSYFQEINNIHTVEDLTYILSRIMNTFTETVFRFADAKHLDVLYKSVLYIKANYMKKLTLEDVANHVYLSPAYLSKIFKDETGYNFNAYLNMVRIEESKKLLLGNTTDLVDIASLVGYEDQSYFSKVFKKLVGLSPGKFRRANYQNIN